MESVEHVRGWQVLKELGAVKIKAAVVHLWPTISTFITRHKK